MSLEPDLETASCVIEPARGREEACADSLAASLPQQHPHAAAHTALSIADSPAFTLHPLSRHFPREATVPRAGELQLWRFRCEWLPVAVPEGETWLSKSERERARLHPNAALRRRFISARVVVRWIVAHLFGCTPRAVELLDDGSDKLRAHHPRDGGGIAIDIVYGGIWIVIGIATTALGVSVVVPAPGIALNETPEGLRRRARHDSLRSALRDAPVDFDHEALRAVEPVCFALDLAQHGAWHLLDLPMNGKVHAAVATAQPLTEVRLIGWPKKALQ
ncbi:4'-phosphopantetheinyl transferase family protein [Paraburkholderia antibiotica]|uniref:4'-phosphopantetheinyl transferase n=1 Tax=Paraburkholderia antibiotica TaxID=2728839 RepID=A0A7X9X6T4_9BURK|nr:hypothetical protein [Paraburkholderia antibiotica]NML32536.1 hypothetical protein [Paraburkholderia antibiotica]